jgi:multiple sugar transport system ATP-binding protein
MARVWLDGIARQFDRVAAIEDITVEIPDGEFWVLVGPSGCGKSTILRTIAGLEAATSGNLYIGETRVNQIPARQRDVAMVFQNYALYPHMTVAENLAFGLRMRKADPTQIRQRVEEVARSLSISHLLDRKPKQLSGGQQQRVALGRAIARQPQVFLLDEPLSNLDAQLRDETRAELKQLHAKLGVTTIYVTHDQVEAMTLADRIVVLDRGRIQQIGDPLTVYNAPANRMVATFLGNPAMNILYATWTGEGLQVSGQLLPELTGIATKLQARPGQGFDLGIRPEHLAIAADAGHLVGTVILVEPLGRETSIRVTVGEREGSQILTLQVDPALQPHPGDLVNLQFDRDRLFIFDPDTGAVLHPEIDEVQKSMR